VKVADAGTPLFLPFPLLPGMLTTYPVLMHTPLSSRDPVGAAVTSSGTGAVDVNHRPDPAIFAAVTIDR
jgi:hypothetical protein